MGRPAAAEATARFCCGIIDAVAPYVVAVKPQLAFFEVLGSDGIAAFERVVGYARAAGLLVIVDGKRGDIGSTARAYADAYLEPSEGREPARRRAHRQHVSRPRLARAVRRRLPPGRRRDLLPRQDLERRQRRRPGPRRSRTAARSGSRWRELVRELGEELIGDCGLSSVGAVVGATHPRAVGEARRLLPQAILLLPGVGAQGATPADIARAFTSGPASALVNASRSVMYAFREGEERLACGRGGGGRPAEPRGVDGLGLVDRPDLRRAGGLRPVALPAGSSLLRAWPAPARRSCWR